MMWVLVVVVITTAWLFCLSYLIYKVKAHYERLTARTKKGSIDDVLEELLKNDTRLEGKLRNVEATTQTLLEESKKHYQKLGFVRFNPFERVGGEQSFVLALLDNKNCGMVLNFLYTRDGIRVYAKKVVDGKSAEYELSTEEKEAIRGAR